MTGEPRTGMLLVATPKVSDPNFERAVVLILDHDEDGTLGVVVNRPTEMSVTSVLEPWTDFVSAPDVLFQGGPVAKNSALALAELPAGTSDEESPLGWRKLYGRLGLIDLDAPPELVAGGLGSMRVFAGYSGWSPGMLEREIADGGWYVVDAEPEDPFTEKPEDMWRQVLRRQFGDLALVATFPEDPTLN